MGLSSRMPLSSYIILYAALAVILVLLVSLLYGVFFFFDILGRPWAYSFGGWPTLTGTWHGTLRTPSGQDAVLFLDIRRSYPESYNYSNGKSYGFVEDGDDFRGQARTCGLANGEREYSINGNMEGWHQPIINFQPKHLATGLHPGRLQGQWHDNLLTLSGQLKRFDGRTWVYGGNQDPDTDRTTSITLRKGTQTDYKTACAKTPT